jgi:hypothetical protein
VGVDAGVELHADRWFFSACTSTSCFAPHAALCGWLLPGPWSVPVYPAATAICPAVWPLPYAFVKPDVAVAYVFCFVVLDDFTPTAFVPPVAGAVAEVVLCFATAPWVAAEPFPDAFAEAWAETFAA